MLQATQSFSATPQTAPAAGSSLPRPALGVGGSPRSGIIPPPGGVPTNPQPASIYGPVHTRDCPAAVRPISPSARLVASGGIPMDRRIPPHRRRRSRASASRRCAWPCRRAAPMAPPVRPRYSAGPGQPRWPRSQTGRPTGLPPHALGQSAGECQPEWPRAARPATPGTWSVGARRTCPGRRPAA